MSHSSSSGAHIFTRLQKPNTDDSESETFSIASHRVYLFQAEHAIKYATSSTSFTPKRFVKFHTQVYTIFVLNDSINRFVVKKKGNYRKKSKWNKSNSKIIQNLLDPVTTFKPLIPEPSVFLRTSKIFNNPLIPRLILQKLTLENTESILVTELKNLGNNPERSNCDTDSVCDEKTNTMSDLIRLKKTLKKKRFYLMSAEKNQYLLFKLVEHGHFM